MSRPRTARAASWLASLALHLALLVPVRCAQLGSDAEARRPDEPVIVLQSIVRDASPAERPGPVDEGTGAPVGTAPEAGGDTTVHADAPLAATDTDGARRDDALVDDAAADATVDQGDPWDPATRVPPEPAPGATTARATPSHDDARADDPVGAADDADTDPPEPEPDDALTPQALPDPSTEREDEVLPDKEEEPAPPEPEEPPLPPQELHFVRADESQRDDPHAVTPPDLIGAIDAWAQRDTRTPVTAAEFGELTPVFDGQTSEASSPSLVSWSGDPADPRGQKTETPEPTAEERVEHGGGGRRALETGAGSPSEHGDRREAGPAAERSGGEATSAAAPTAVARASGQDAGESSGAGAQEGFPFNPVGDRQLEVDAPAWWNPVVSRAVYSPRARPAVAPEVVVSSPTDSDAVALVDRKGRKADRGGTAAPVEVDEPAPPTDVVAPDGIAEDTPKEKVRARDPVADLRDALGWGEQDRTKIRPRADASGPQTFDGARPTSPQTATPDDRDLDVVSFVTVRDTPIGRYTDRVYTAVLERWLDADLSEHDRASGVQGRVTVSFRIHRSGRVSDLRITQSSGHLSLDELALRSIPARLPRFPKDVEGPSMTQQITLHYRNPIISPPEWSL